MSPEDPQAQPPEQPVQPDQPQPPQAANVPQPAYIPPPGYPPPGNPPPAAYPPPGATPGYGAQQPPPNYPPGYVPPGYAPGYAYPGYYPPPAPYVPPAQYHVPAADGRPPQMVPPASGSLLQAWVSIATRPSRQNIAAWAQIANAGWVRASIIVAAIIQTLYVVGLLFGIVSSVLSAQNASSSTVSTSFQMTAPFFAIGVLIVPLFYLLEFFAIPFGQALFMSSGLGTVRQRYVRALKPWALVQVGITAVTFIFGLLLLLLFQVVLLPGLHALAVSTGNGSDVLPSTFFTALFSFLGLILLVSIPFSIYQYMMQIQSGAVGAAMNRWAIFGINLLTGFVLGVALNIVFQIISFGLFAHSGTFVTPIVTPGP